MRRTLKYIGAVIALVIVGGFSSAVAYRRYVQAERAAVRAIHSPRGISTLEPVRIGGIDQWIEVRGQNLENPILLFIHGGPGIAFIPFADMFQRPWEERFTVVQWDQRGAGKTYASNDRDLQRRTTTLHRMQQDAVEVVNYLRRRFGKKKIVVLGASWGSILGWWLAHEHPDLVDAYVGVAQAINTTQASTLAYQDALRAALTRGNQRAIGELEGIAPYPVPFDLRKGAVANRWEAELLGPTGGPQFLDGRRLAWALFSAPQYSLADVLGFARGQLFSLEVLIPQLQRLDLAALGRDFRVPVFFFQGRHDPYLRPSLIQKYSQTVTAPRTELVWFENSGHFPFFEEQQRFNEQLFRVTARSSRGRPAPGTASPRAAH